MNSNTPKYILAVLFLSFLIACSTKKDTFLARNSHALSTKLNILYNGQIALDKGVKGIKDNSPENFWKRLPVEKMQVSDDLPVDGKSKNADFELAEAKATKAIQKHSMNIDGREKNYQIDEAYLLLGKARYYDQRFIPALDAFNYILYKYPNSSNNYEARIWREKTNIRLGNDAAAIRNTSKLIKDNELSNQEFADANAILASAFLNIEEKDSAIVKLKLANKKTKRNEDKERYSFLLGQLYEESVQKDSAIYFYQTVIDMNRKAERKFVIQAYAKKAKLNNYKNEDYDLFVEKSKKIMKDRENRPYLDVIYHNIGIFYDNNKDKKMALDFYKASLETKSTDPYLNASNYRNIGNMYFKDADYLNAAKNYDQCLALLDVKSREFLKIQKTRKDLDEVILDEAIAKRNDSIIYVAALKEPEQIVYYENYIQKLKSRDELKKLLEDKQKKIENNIALNSALNVPDGTISNIIPGMPNTGKGVTPPDNGNPTVKEKVNTFYFYNPNAVAYGKLEFKKRWGNRTQVGYWRVSATAGSATDNNPEAKKTDTTTVAKTALVVVNEKYTTEYYMKQLPKSQTVIDSLVKERNLTYYKLGVTYKEKFKEYNLASTKLEQLLAYNPEEKLILPTKYNLYKIYQITNSAKAEALKNEITTQYPNSRYANIVNNSSSLNETQQDTPEGEYIKLYRLYEEEYFASVLKQVEGLISDFSGDPIVSKFELLKAYTIGKRYGLEAYKSAIQYVADNYATTEEGKNAIEILKTQIPLLEQMNFSTADSKNWKVIFRIANNDEKSAAAIESKLALFFANENVEKLKYTCDSYTEKESFISIHGIHTESYAKFVAALLVENIKYKINQPGIIISNENYKIIQIKKNLEAYLSLKKL
ncbi:gliding motility protein [Flavobacterium sp. ZT3R18]|uniref:type IX secretion system periplasmic lipoprotein PorW/SprE n=1 Tax=Flavobacterium sp. ZT3R18 TaxID=2594429 RepID=UPI001179ED6A|nr:gliding motility protein [Flavobacterium sp. ZT3R18]TRX37890.1 gliding motility protein [Flavobacterium sp. ZT3R18]